jgi:hypothetical protein
VSFTVDTTGPPLDQELVNDLTRPFRRLRTDRTGSVRGVGLGLSIVAAIATVHRGTLALHARAQGGLRVVIDLPLPQPAAEVDGARHRAVPAASGEPSR